MNNFEYYNPTKLIFGEEVISKLQDELKGKYKKVLLHYGKDSIKKYGVYDQVIENIKTAGAEIVELSGVEPNPKLNLVREGIKICKAENIDFILSVGGGSVIDSAKAIAAGALEEFDVWEFFEGKRAITKAIPTGVVLTIPATGSESSPNSIITNEEGLLKRGIESDLLRPVFSIMDPKVTTTLPDNQTFAGIMDILSHVFERYFSNTSNTELTDGLCEATIRAVIINALVLKENPNDLAARGEIMVAGTIAHNGILGLGREEDWGSHRIAHEISALYGTTHGETLSVVFPAWMRYVYGENPRRFGEFAQRIFNFDPDSRSDEENGFLGIIAFETFLRDINMPLKLSDINVKEEDIELMATKCTLDGPVGRFKALEKEDVINILNIAK